MSWRYPDHHRKNLMFLWRSQNKWRETPGVFCFFASPGLFLPLSSPLTVWTFRLPPLSSQFGLFVCPHSPPSLGLFFSLPGLFLSSQLGLLWPSPNFGFSAPHPRAFELLQLGFICHPEVSACSPTALLQTPPESLLAPPKPSFYHLKTFFLTPLQRLFYLPLLLTHVHTCTHTNIYTHMCCLCVWVWLFVCCVFVVCVVCGVLMPMDWNLNWITHP